MERPTTNLRKGPIWTAILAICTLVVYLLPVQQALIYDRQAIMHGQLWRLVTGHLVHFTPEHLVVNLLLLTVAGGLIERGSPRGLSSLFICSALLISMAMLWLLPQMATFGGLSGVVSAFVAALAVSGQGKGWRWSGIAVLLILTCKVVFETTSDSSLLFLSRSQPFVPVSLAHAVGICVGMGMGLRTARSAPPEPAEN